MLKYGFIIIGAIFSLYIFYACSARYLKIKDLPVEIISSADKLKYLSILQKYILITVISSGLTLLTLLSPVLELRFLIPIVAMFLSSFIFMNLSDEIADFDISKKDSDIVQEFLEKRSKVSKDNAKENKIKRIDIDELGIKDDVDEFNKTEEKEEL